MRTASKENEWPAQCSGFNKERHHRLDFLEDGVIFDADDYQVIGETPA
jgi:hypothetical protein